MNIIVKDPDELLVWTLSVAADDPEASDLIARWLVHVLRQYNPTNQTRIPATFKVEFW